MYRPLFWIAAAFIIGIFTQNAFSLNPVLLIIVSAVFFFFSIILYKKENILLSFSLIAVTFIPLGAIHFDITVNNPDPDYIKNMVSNRTIELNKKAEIVFKVVENPVQFENRISFYASLVRIMQNKKTYNAHGRIIVNVSIPSKAETNGILPETGDIYRVISTLQEITRYQNSDQDKWDDYRLRQGVYFSIYVNSLQALDKINGGKRISIVSFSKRLREKLGNFVDHSIKDKDKAAIIKSVTLGIIDDDLQQLRYQLRISGIIHITVISGLHIGILTISLLFIMRKIGLSLRKRYMYTIIVLVLFCISIGFYPSVLRATLLAVIYLLGGLLGRRADFLNILSLAALIILFINPRDLFSPGFQFTFLICIILYETLSIFKITERSSWKRYLGELVLVSLSAFIISLPLMAYHFNQIPVLGLLCNLMVTPAIFIIINVAIPFYLLAAVGIEIPFIFDKIMNPLASYVEIVSQASLYLKESAIRIPTPNLILVLLNLLLIFTLLFLLRKGYVGPLRTITIILIVITSIAIAIHPFPPDRSDEMRVHFLDVGQGESILIELPDNKVILIDGGGQHEKSEFIGEKVVSRFLWNKGIKKIDLMILTHSDIDHIGGLWVVARNFKIGEFWENGLNPPSRVYRRLKSFIPETNKQFIIREGTGKLYRDLDFELTCLSPSANLESPSIASNDDSLVLFIRYKKTRMIFTGDAGAEIEKRLIKSYPGYNNIDLLKVGHHGSNVATSEGFLEYFKPKYAIISVGKHNRYGFPSRYLLRRLSSRNIKIYRTDLNGRIMAICNGSDIRIEKSNPF